LLKPSLLQSRSKYSNRKNIVQHTVISISKLLALLDDAVIHNITNKEAL